MAAFHETLFPFAVSLGASGGPERRTEIVTLASGREERNTPWAHSRRRWDAGGGVKTLDDLHAVIEFFEARRGALHGFRFKDPLDHKSCPPGQTPGMTDQTIGIGDGETRDYQLSKTYQHAGEGWVRTIHKPVSGTVMLAVDGAALDPADYTLDAASGAIVLNADLAVGAVLSAGYAFDTPARFATDRLDLSIEGFKAGQAVSLPLIEIIP